MQPSAILTGTPTIKMDTPAKKDPIMVPTEAAKKAGMTKTPRIEAMRVSKLRNPCSESSILPVLMIEIIR